MCGPEVFFFPSYCLTPSPPAAPGSRGRPRGSRGKSTASVPTVDIAIRYANVCNVHRYVSSAREKTAVPQWLYEGNIAPRPSADRAVRRRNNASNSSTPSERHSLVSAKVKSPIPPISGDKPSPPETAALRPSAAAATAPIGSETNSSG